MIACFSSLFATKNASSDYCRDDAQKVCALKEREKRFCLKKKKKMIVLYFPLMLLCMAKSKAIALALTWERNEMFDRQTTTSFIGLVVYISSTAQLLQAQALRLLEWLLHQTYLDTIHKRKTYTEMLITDIRMGQIELTNYIIQFLLII